MNTEAIIKQLKKALDCKDDKELRLRVEVIVDLLEETSMVRTPMSLPQVQQVSSRVLPDPAVDLGPKVTYTVSGQKSNKVRGAGSITSTNSEQINYRRPKGT